MNYYIKKDNWEHIYALLIKRRDIKHRQEDKLRIFIEGVYYILKTGCQWRMLPKVYGKYRSIHKRFQEWNDKAIWNYLFQNTKKDPDMESILLDSTIVRAHACSAGYRKDSQTQEALGRSRGGFTTKIHALVDALGNPLKFILTPGQSHDITQSQSLIEEMKDTIVIADKGYAVRTFFRQFSLRIQNL